MSETVVKKLGTVIVELNTGAVTIEGFTFVGGDESGLTDVRDRCAALVLPMVIDLLRARLESIYGTQAETETKT